MLIELRGLQFVNKGAELMLRAILQKLPECGAEYKLAMRHSEKSPKDKVDAIGALRKITLQKNILNLNFVTYFVPKFIRNFIMNKFDVVFEADIDIVLDGSGFAYGDQWSSMAIQQLCLEINRLNKHGKKYIFLPQALGPFSRDKDREALAKSLPKAELIIARERESVKNLEATLANTQNVHHFPDFTNIVKGNLPDYYTNGNRKFLIIPNNKMLSSKNNNTEWSDRYVDILVASGKFAISEGYEVAILNHEGVKDDNICKQIQAALDKDIEIIRESDPLKVKGIIGASRALICSRFHGCVSALSQGVPVIGTSWSFKYEQLYAEYGQKHRLVGSDISEGNLATLVSEALAEGQMELSEEALEYKEQSMQMWELVFTAIKNADSSVK